MKKIMVVDDDEMNLKMAELILQSKDYDVIMVESGMKCLDYLKQRDVDLVLLDIEMPVLNGIKTLELIRSNKATKEIPVMFLTATADTETVSEASRLGVAGYVKKPFMPQDLLERVEKVVG